MRCKRCCRMLHTYTMEESERFMFRPICPKCLPFQNIVAILFIIGVLLGCVTCAEQLQPPRFNMQPSSTSSIVSEGRTKILQCSALGIPQPTYRWLRNGQPLGEYSSELFYKVLNTRRSDAGAYQCVAKNDVGAIFSEKNHVTVAYMGIFEDVAEQTVSVESGKAAVLELPTIESYPRPSVIWQDEFGPLRYDHKYAFSRDHQLIILACSKDDEKAYRARAINTQLGKEENSPYIKLKVIGDDNKEVLPEIIIKPEDTKIVKGQEVTELQCIANARPLHELETLWFKDGILIDMAGISYDLNDPWNRTLGLISANLTHTGQYQCQVKLKTGGSPTVTAEATVTVQEKPMFLSSLRLETLAAFGSTVTLNCDVQGVPAPSITWYRDSKKVGSTGDIANDVEVTEFDNGNGRYFVEEDRSLRIQNVRTEDMGIFQCIAANDAGEASIHTVLKIKNKELRRSARQTKQKLVRVRSSDSTKTFRFDSGTSAPVLLSGPANVTLLDGADATLVCRAAGAPTPNVTWYFNDTLVMSKRGRVQTLEEGDLLVTGTAPGDTGKYTCVRANDAGHVTGEAYLSVLVGTKVVAPPVDTRVLLGHTASLQCKVTSDASVPFNIDWLHNNQVVVPGSRVWVSAEGSLEVSAARASDAGWYACVVTSPGGNHTRRATLAVVELPFAPTNVRAAPALLHQPSRAVNLSWTPGFDGNSPLTKFIVQKREVPEFGPVPDPLLNWVTELHNVSSTARWVLLTSLKAATAYQFRVSAVNTVGEGSPSDPTNILILPQEAPSGPPIGFVGSARSSSEIITQWQPPLEEHRNGHILGYIIRYRLFGYNHSPWTDQNITNEVQRNFLIQDLITWKDYVVQIAAYNDKGVGVFTEGAKIKTKEGVPEAPPVNVTSEAYNSTAVTLRWTPPDPQKINGINQGYKIQAWRWHDEGQENVEQVSMSVPPNLLDPLAQQCAVLAGLDKYTLYNVSVLCFTHPGDGQRSPFVSVLTNQDVPDEVGSLQFDEVSDRALKVIWSPPKQVNGVLVGYKLQYEIKGRPETVKEEVVAPNITSLRVDNLQATTQYKFWVSALTEMGAGEARAATIQSGVEPVLPHAPHNLALSNIHAFSVLLQFTPGFDGNSSISKWIVQAQTARNTSWITVYELSAPDAQSILVPSLVPFTTYRLRVIANNVVGASEPSAPCKEFQTIQAPPKHPPNNVTVRAVSATHLRVRWIPLQQSEWYGNPRGYNISYRLAGADTDAGHAVIDDHTANSHILAGLEEWTPYEIRMTALNEVGSSEQSFTASERTREAVPSEGPESVSANATSSTTVVVVWGEVAAQHCNGLIEGYKVCYVPAGGGPAPPRPYCRAVPSNLTHTLTLTELRKYVLYQVRVLAYTRLGDGELSEPPATVTTYEDTPGAPSNVSFPDVTFTSARIIWDMPEHPNGEILAYKVTYSLNSTTEHIYSREFLPSDRTFRAIELTSDSYYLFTVTAQTRLGWGAVARAMVFTTANRATPQAPSPPLVSLGQLQAHHITFSWTPGRDGFAPLRYYTIQQKEDGATWKSIPERVDPFSTSYTASDLKPFTAYQFRIRATNDIGPSSFSNSSNTVRTLPAAPSKLVEGVHVVPITTNSVSVSWHTLERQHWSGDTDTAGYRVLYQPVSDFPTALHSTSKEEVMGIKSDHVVLTSLSVDRNYEITVVGFNAQGAGPRGAPAMVWVGEAVPTAPPRAVQAEALSPTEVLIRWQAPLLSQQNGDLLGYKIFYLMTESPEEMDPTKKIEEELEVVPATSSSHSLVFLDKYTKYRVQVLAFNPAGDGPRSSAVEVTTLQGLPGTPRHINFTDITMTSMTLTWEAPEKKNGLIVGYIVTYETTQQDEKFSKQVKQKVTSRRLVVSGLEEEVEYSVWVRALTLEAGPALQASVRTGPQPGSPVPPHALRVMRGAAAVDLHWDNSPSGKGPLLGYYIESRKKDNTRWETVTRTSNGHLEEFTISYQSLLPSTAYSFRVISYNVFGISYPAYCEDVIVTPSKLYLEYGYLQYRPFYRQTWFMVALAAVSVIIIIMVISVLCVKSKTYKYKQEAQKTLEESLAIDSDERGSLAMELYRARQGSSGNMGAGGTLRRPQSSLMLSGTLPGSRSKHTIATLGKSPPRPSPASVAYHSDEESLHGYDENPDDSSVTEKPSELSSSDSQNSESENESIRSDPHSFVNHYANVNDSLRQSWKRQKPVRNYSSYTDSEPEGSAVVSLNGGQIIMNNMARSRAPLPGFSSFV